jgi:predicted HTH domain antitoxin
LHSRRSVPDIALRQRDASRFVPPYELGRLSSDKVARPAGLDRVEFLHELGRIGVPAINLREEEAEAEVQADRDLAG